ncbi:aminodeoxychorismate synthase component I [Thiotrichales bacterium 19S3-7]|nr:aminodeoxychorismate synthase component I [Thiotrichales bacterium 19S3-7]MCF6801862.1 aminodeoxychorismate synthase component I [Thiotrichales bacterium 19S3-11]
MKIKLLKWNAELMDTNSFALLYDAKLKENNILYFDGLVTEIICFQQDKLELAIQQIERYQKNGFYAVGCINFETGYLLDDALASYYRHSQFPLLAFKIFKQVHYLSKYDLPKFLTKYRLNQASFIYNFHLIDDYEVYQQQFNNVQNALKNGETYQINLTSKYNFEFQGQALDFYFKLIQQQSASYCAYMEFNQWQILSISPELFFKKEGDTIRCKPMKGTIKRHSNPEIDEQNKLFLANDLKNKTENVIIVDLLRNDLADISQVGSVNVATLFEIETFETVYQMTSTIESKFKSDISLYKLFSQLFPCGSITGAPKVSTMKHIAQIETEPRNLYTGSIGYIKPNGDMCFNVAIRTLLIDKKTNQGELGAGGGITISSEVNDEWEELKLKANFVRQVHKPFDLIECILYKNNAYQHLDKHINRLENSAQIFNFVFDRYHLLDQLMELTAELQSDKAYKVKILLAGCGKVSISFDEALSISQPIKLIIANEPIDSSNILFQHKTTAHSVRGFYDQMVSKYRQQTDCFDVIFYNEKGYITETSIFNLIVEIKGQLYTPKINSGLLPGIGRSALIEQGKVHEKNITKNELVNADAIYVVNSIRGLIETKLLIAYQYDRLV